MSIKGPAQRASVALVIFSNFCLEGDELRAPVQF